MVIWPRFTSYSLRQIKPFQLLTQQQISIQQQKYAEHFNVHFYEYEIVAIFVRVSKKGAKKNDDFINWYKRGMNNQHWMISLFRCCFDGDGVLCAL